MLIPKIKFTFTIENDVKTKDLFKIKSSKDIVRLLPQIFSPETLYYKETFIVIFLNHANGVIGYNKLSDGGLTGTVVDIRHLFGQALALCATSIILSHNHPSGTLRPSQADLRLTSKIKEAGTLLDIQLLDHVIYTDSGYYSFTDEGAL